MLRTHVMCVYPFNVAYSNSYTTGSHCCLSCFFRDTQPTIFAQLKQRILDPVRVHTKQRRGKKKTAATTATANNNVTHSSTRISSLALVEPHLIPIRALWFASRPRIRENYAYCVYIKCVWYGKLRGIYSDSIHFGREFISLSLSLALYARVCVR